VVQFPADGREFLFSKVDHAHPSPCLAGTGTLSPAVKRSGPEGVNSLHLVARSSTILATPPLTPTRLHDVHRDNFIVVAIQETFKLA
jgi:hypothetical protein